MFRISTLYKMNLPGETSLADSLSPSPDPPKRHLSLDFLRGLACLAVVAGHVTSTFIYNETSFTLWGMNLAFVLNQAARFSVPLFLFLSGLSLGLGRQPQAYGDFLKTRCRRLLLPYVLWVLVYEFYNASFDLGAWVDRLADPKVFLLNLLTGHASPHLYFIPLLFQFYLLYPLLKKWADRNPQACFLWSLALSLLIQGLHCLDGLDLIPFSLSNWLVKTAIGWSFYFVAGVCFQMADLNRLRRSLHGCQGPLTIIFLVFALLYSVWSLYTGLLDSIKPELMLYTLLVFLWGITLWPHIQCRPVTAAVTFLSRHSLNIYFNHVLILCFLRYVPRFSLGMSGMGLLFLGTLFLSVLAAWILQTLGAILKTS